MKEIVIKLEDYLYERISKVEDADVEYYYMCQLDRADMYKAIRNGKVLPPGHGRLIDIDKAVVNEETFRKYFSITTHPLMNGKIINCVAPSVVEADMGEE